MSHHRRFRSSAAIAVVILLLSQGCAFGQGQLPSSPMTPANPTAVLAWNAIAQRTAIAVAKQFQTQSMIYISLAQAAVYDAVVSIEGVYQPYALNLDRRPGASIDAAVASAAHAVLVHYFAAQQAALDA